MLGRRLKRGLQHFQHSAGHHHRHMPCGLAGLGFGVWGLGLGVWGLRFRVEGLRFRVEGLRCRFRVDGFRIESLRWASGGPYSNGKIVQTNVDPNPAGRILGLQGL